MKRLIFDGPKYLSPLIEEIELRFLNNLANVPEKLLQRLGSKIISPTADFGRQVKFPNFIDWLVNIKVKHL